MRKEKFAVKKGEAGLRMTSQAMRRMLWVGGGIALVVCAGFFIHHFKKENVTIQTSHYLSRIKQFLSARKTHIQHGLSEVKHIATQKPESYPQPIHFEFYTVLPNAEVRVDSLESNSNESAIANELKQSSPVIREMPQKKLPIVAGSKIADADELVSELSREIKHEYAVQLAVFQNEKAAERYHLALKQAGLVVAVYKDQEHGKTLYRIQQGPFKNMEHAKIAQKQLKKRGIESTLRKHS